MYSGGVSNCVYQVGFTKALLEYIDRSEIVAISGASGGLFSAYALSANKLDSLEYLYRKIDISNKLELFWQVFAKGILAHNLDSLVSVSDELDIPMYFPVCYIPIMNTKYYRIKGEYNRTWKKYITAATNFPLLKIFPAMLKGRFAIDGGAADNIPLYPLIKEGKRNDLRPDIIFVLHCDSAYDYRGIFDTDIPIVDLDLSICNNFSKNHYDYSESTISKRIEKSYEYGQKICSKIFIGDKSHEHFQRAADEIFLSEHTARLRNKNLVSYNLLAKLNMIGRALRRDTDCFHDLYFSEEKI